MEKTLAAGDSTGLAGMRERADLLDGTLTIDSLPGEGTTIHADLPITRAFEMAAAHETDEDLGYTNWQTPVDNAARHAPGMTCETACATNIAMRPETRDEIRSATRCAI